METAFWFSLCVPQESDNNAEKWWSLLSPDQRGKSQSSWSCEPAVGVHEGPEREESTLKFAKHLSSSHVSSLKQRLRLRIQTWLLRLKKWLSSYKSMCCSRRRAKFRSQHHVAWLTITCDSNLRGIHRFQPWRSPAHLCTLHRHMYKINMSFLKTLVMKKQTVISIVGMCQIETWLPCCLLGIGKWWSCFGNGLMASKFQANTITMWPRNMQTCTNAHRGEDSRNVDTSQRHANG